MTILIISPTVPIPPRSGYAIRLLNLIKGLSQNNKIDLITINYDGVQEEDIAEIRKYCQNVFLVAWRKRSKLQQIWPIMKKFMAQEPFFTKYVESEDLKKLVYNLSHKEKYQIIMVEHSIMANYLRCLNPCHGAKTVISMIDVIYPLYLRRHKVERNIFEKVKILLTLIPIRSWESKLISNFDKVISVSEPEKQMLLAQNPNLDISVIPNGVDTKFYYPIPREGRMKNIIFVGSMEYKPNLDAVIYFYREILPLLREKDNEITLTVIGRKPPRYILQLNNEIGIKVEGDVDDVRPYYRNALVSIVPLRSGGGTRLKILEAMALGTPVVSTSIGCEGLDVENGRNILIADDPFNFVHQIMNLMTDVKLWNRLSQNGRTLVEEKYDWTRITKDLDEVFRELVRR